VSNSSSDLLVGRRIGVGEFRMRSGRILTLRLRGGFVHLSSALQQSHIHVGQVGLKSFS
jgi:hypothetical protein